MKAKKLSDVKGMMEYRFVPTGWAPPDEFAYLTWFEFDAVKHADEYARRRADIEARRELRAMFDGRESDLVDGHVVTWFRNGQSFHARVDFDAVERPVLVVIGGL